MTEIRYNGKSYTHGVNKAEDIVYNNTNVKDELDRINSKNAYGSWTGEGNSHIIELPDNVMTKCPLVQSLGLNGNGFTIYDGGVRVNEDGVYMISASVYTCINRGDITAETKIQKSVHIRNQNDVELASTSDNVYDNLGGEGCHGGISISPKIVNLSAGDIIYLCGRMVWSNGLMYTGNSATYLTIMRLG